MLPIQELRQAFAILPHSTEQYYICAEDGEMYDVCLVQSAQGECVIKRAKGDEANIYRALLTGCPGVPTLYGTHEIGTDAYLLLERAPGEPILHLDRASLTKILDALIQMQAKYWNFTPPANLAYTFDNALDARRARGTHLHDKEIERAYATYLELFCTLPRTLCHDDLLPFNVLVSKENATLIDWEIAGILPYPTPLARLLAHAQDTPDAFFYATDADKAFAAQYYYDGLVAPRGIPLADFARALRYFTLYEYCEWIMVGNKYHQTDSPRYQQYCALARALLPTLH